MRPRTLKYVMFGSNHEYVVKLVTPDGPLLPPVCAYCRDQELVCYVPEELVKGSPFWVRWTCRSCRSAFNLASLSLLSMPLDFREREADEEAGRTRVIELEEP